MMQEWSESKACEVIQEWFSLLLVSGTSAFTGGGATMPSIMRSSARMFARTVSRGGFESEDLWGCFGCLLSLVFGFGILYAVAFYPWVTLGIVAVLIALTKVVSSRMGSKLQPKPPAVAEPDQTPDRQNRSTGNPTPPDAAQSAALPKALVSPLSLLSTSQDDRGSSGSQTNQEDFPRRVRHCVAVALTVPTVREHAAALLQDQLRDLFTTPQYTLQLEARLCGNQPLGRPLLCSSDCDLRKGPYRPNLPIPSRLWLTFKEFSRSLDDWVQFRNDTERSYAAWLLLRTVYEAEQSH